jgi:hypothetical protein
LRIVIDCSVLVAAAWGSATCLLASANASGPQSFLLRPHRHLQPVQHLLRHDLPEAGQLAVELAQDWVAA